MPAPKKRVGSDANKTGKTTKVATRTKGARSEKAVVYQFKITLLDSRPPIWRRIVVADGTLDELHEHIQTAMGWTNSHLHEFEIGAKRYGDPEMLDDLWGEAKFASSLETKLSELFGGKRAPQKFHYTYDFGDGWEHRIEFEGTAPAEPGQKYPFCVKGKRACPPEDVGGVWGYVEFLEAVRNPKHEQYEFYLEWTGDDFDPEEFNPDEATKAMRKRLPNWRDLG